MNDVHDLVMNHACGEYTTLSGEACYRAEACAECGVRRDEHADQGLLHTFSALDITSHAFRQMTHLECYGVEA